MSTHPLDPFVLASVTASALGLVVVARRGLGPRIGAVLAFAFTAGAAAGLSRHVAVVLSSFLAVPHALAETDLAAIVPAPFARALEARGLVRCAPLPPEIAQPRLRMRMLWSPRVGDAPAWRWMRDVVVDVARERALTSA